MKNLKNVLMIGLIGLSSLPVFSQSTFGIVKGLITNSQNEAMIGVTIKVTQSGVLIGGTVTDVDGKYTYKPLNPGIYEVIVSSMEIQQKRINNVKINPDATSYVDIKVEPKTDIGIIIVEGDYYEPIVAKSMFSIKTMDADAFVHTASGRGDINAAVVGMASDVMQDNDGGLHFRGSRVEATQYIVDGVKSPNITGVPAQSVENLSVITGGIPAQYGDMTGGVIVITTKDYFTGMRSKRIRQNSINENKERVKREMNVIAEEKKRKKEIEEELRLEEEAKELKEKEAKAKQEDTPNVQQR